MTRNAGVDRMIHGALTPQVVAEQYWLLAHKNLEKHAYFSFRQPFSCHSLPGTEKRGAERKHLICGLQHLNLGSKIDNRIISELVFLRRLRGPEAQLTPRSGNIGEEFFGSVPTAFTS